MRISSTREWVRIVSESDVLDKVVTPGGEATARNISEWHKIM
jgi:glutamine amidotransferase PdxT